MNLPDDLLSSLWLWLGHALYVPVLIYALLRAPWARLRESEALHVFLGTCAALMVLWSMRAGIAPGLTFHLLGTTLLTLMFGWELAVVGIGLVLAAVTIAGMSGVETFSLNALVMGTVPALVGRTAYFLVWRRLPHNLFVYIFVSGFFGAALAIAVVAFASTALFLASGVYTWDQLIANYLPYALLLALPEAFVTGTCITYMVVYRPAWVGSYREETYLGR
jgi:uncharacterized membrane protein